MSRVPHVMPKNTRKKDQFFFLHSLHMKPSTSFQGCCIVQGIILSNCKERSKKSSFITFLSSFFEKEKKKPHLYSNISLPHNTSTRTFYSLSLSALIHIVSLVAMEIEEEEEPRRKRSPQQPEHHHTVRRSFVRSFVFFVLLLLLLLLLRVASLFLSVMMCLRSDMELSLIHI